jgi:hypothetical protein
MKNIFENCKTKEDLDLVYSTVSNLINNDPKRVEYEQELNSMYQEAMTNISRKNNQLEKLVQTVDQVSDVFSVIKSFLHSIK